MKSPFKKIGRSLQKLEKSAERELKTAGKTVETGSKAVAKSVEKGAKATGRAVSAGAHKVGDVAHDAAEGVGDAASAVGRGAKAGFEKVVRAGEAAFDEVRADLAALSHHKHDADLIAKAEAIAAQHASAIIGLHAQWSTVQHSLADDIATLRCAAKARDGSPEAQAALHRIMVVLKSAIARFEDSSLAGVGLEIGGSAGGSIAVADGSVGFLCGLPNLKNFHVYGSVMASLGSGWDVGASGDISVTFVVGPPEDSGGPNVSVVGHLVAAAGGTITVAFDPIKLCLSGFSVGLSAGTQAGVSVGAGYTYVF